MPVDRSCTRGVPIPSFRQQQPHHSSTPQRRPHAYLLRREYLTSPNARRPDSVTGEPGSPLTDPSCQGHPADPLPHRVTFSSPPPPTTHPLLKPSLHHPPPPSIREYHLFTYPHVSPRCQGNKKLQPRETLAPKRNHNRLLHKPFPPFPQDKNPPPPRPTYGARNAPQHTHNKAQADPDMGIPQGQGFNPETPPPINGVNKDHFPEC
ncbi:hypothetical protein FKM82_002301 [Ascaphus truei]